ncbi:MAG: pilus assembly protein TadG-related protein, partial [Pirellulaceae bacterium]|nr:pilus assembly protein TadG-related protein [Pirellulaceae bacterium]
MAQQLKERRGVITVLAAMLLCVVFGLAAYAIDTGRIMSEHTKMQNAADAASLAASQEIRAAIYEAGQSDGDATIDSNSI